MYYNNIHVDNIAVKIDKRSDAVHGGMLGNWLNDIGFNDRRDNDIIVFYQNIILGML